MISDNGKEYRKEGDAIWCVRGMIRYNRIARSNY
jgi:hypothetical protein